MWWSAAAGQEICYAHRHKERQRKRNVNKHSSPMIDMNIEENILISITRFMCTGQRKYTGGIVWHGDQCAEQCVNLYAHLYTNATNSEQVIMAIIALHCILNEVKYQNILSWFQNGLSFFLSVCIFLFCRYVASHHHLYMLCKSMMYANDDNWRKKRTELMTIIWDASSVPSIYGRTERPKMQIVRNVYRTHAWVMIYICVCAPFTTNAIDVSAIAVASLLATHKAHMQIQ